MPSHWATHTTRKQAKGPGQRYQLLLQPVLMPHISTGCKSSWYLWPAAIKGKVFGTGLKHHPVPKLQYRNRLVPPTGTKSISRNRYRLVQPPVPKGWTMALDFAMARCRHVPTTKAPVSNINRCLCLLFGTGC